MSHVRPTVSAVAISVGEATIIAGAIAGGAAALAAGLASLGTYKASKSAVQEQRGLARDERVTDAYVDLLSLVRTVMIWVDDARPKVRISPRPVSPAIDEAEEIRIRSKVRALGSAEVRASLERWQGHLVAFRVGVGMLDEIAGGVDLPKPDDFPVSEWQGVSKDMHEARDQLRSDTDELEEAVRKELAR